MTDCNENGNDYPYLRIPRHLVTYARKLKLTPTQYNLWLFLWELDPFGDRWVSVPTPDEIAVELNVHPQTIVRAAQRLEDCKLFAFQIQSWKVKNLKPIFHPPTSDADFSPDRVIKNPTNRSKFSQIDQTNRSLCQEKNPEPAFYRSQDCTNNNCSTVLKEQLVQGTPTPTDPVKNEQEKVGKYEELLRKVREAGFPQNRTIRRAIQATLKQKGEFRGYQHCCNAIEAAQEQMARNNVENPGGLLLQAIKRGFSSNAKKKERKQLQSPPTTADPPAPVTAVSPAAASPPDRFEIEQACTFAVIQGDRQFARSKLQQLWEAGWHDLVEEVCRVRLDLKFRCTANGVVDHAAASG